MFQVGGLCGNYNRLMSDDTQMYDVRTDDIGILAFVDKWRTRECEMTKTNTVRYYHITTVNTPL